MINKCSKLVAERISTGGNERRRLRREASRNPGVKAGRVLGGGGAEK